MLKVEELKKIIDEQSEIIKDLKEKVDFLVTKHNECCSCTANGEQMCYDCFYGTDHD